MGLKGPELQRFNPVASQSATGVCRRLRISKTTKISGSKQYNFTHIFFLNN